MSTKLYGDYPAIVASALLYVMRNQAPKGKELVSKARTCGKEIAAKDFSELFNLIGTPSLTLSESSGESSDLRSANYHVKQWLRGYNTVIPKELTNAFDRYSIERMLLEPITLSYTGDLSQADINGHNREWDNFGRNEEIFHKFDLQMLKCLEEHENMGIPDEHRTSFDILKWIVKKDLEGYQFRAHKYVIDQMNGFHSGIVYFLTELTPCNTLGDAENYVARVKAIPERLNYLCDEIVKQVKLGIFPPKVSHTKVLSSIGQIRESLVEPTKSPIYVHLKEKEEEIAKKDDEKKRFTALLDELVVVLPREIDDAFCALEDTVHFSHNEAVDHAGVHTLPNGKEYYNWCLKDQTSTDLTADEIYELGLKEVSTLKQNIQKVLVNLSKIDPEFALDVENKTPIENIKEMNKMSRFLYEDSEEGRKKVMKDFNDLVNEIDTMIDPLFDIRPKTKMEIKPVPSYMEEGSPAAFYQPPSTDGSRPGVFSVNMGDMSAILKYGMRTLTAHEAIPGHHFQLALSVEMKSLPYFRRDANFNAFIEGWGLYSERLAQEIGYYKTEKDGSEGYDLIGHYCDELLRASRLVLDTGLHAKGWSRDEAIDYMTKNTNLAPSDVDTEIDRYCVMPGQATSYKIGQLKLLELREKMKTNLKENFDVKDFHRIVLTSGALPLDVLENVIDNASA